MFFKSFLDFDWNPCSLLFPFAFDSVKFHWCAIKLSTLAEREILMLYFLCWKITKNPIEYTQTLYLFWENFISLSFVWSWEVSVSCWERCVLFRFPEIRLSIFTIFLRDNFKHYLYNKIYLNCNDAVHLLFGYICRKDAWSLYFSYFCNIFWQLIFKQLQNSLKAQIYKESIQPFAEIMLHLKRSICYFSTEL